jgi:hypothetical protein
MVHFSVLTDICATVPVVICPEAASAAPIIVEHSAENIRESTSGGVIEFIRRPSLETTPQAFICPTCIKPKHIIQLFLFSFAHLTNPINLFY